MLAQSNPLASTRARTAGVRRAIANRPVQSRTGATLVFVVTLLVLFTLAGTTFLVVASQFQQSAKQAARSAIYVQPPRNFTEDALYDLIRGNTGNNIMAPHSILGDKYDVLGGFKGRVQTIANLAPTGNSFMALSFQALPTSPTDFAVRVSSRWDDPMAAAYPMSQVAGAYNGCELTFLDGPAAGITCRIVGYLWANGPQFVIMVDNADVNVSAFPPEQAAIDFLDVNVLVNGRPFSGLGAGQGGIEALRPNRTQDTPANLVSNYLATGTNESYDVADFQNMFLGALSTDDNGRLRYIPSFHRPALINYWKNGPGNTQLTQAQVMMTPDPQTNTAGPNFPAMADPINGPWQVDNTGDGVRDSVWLDLGYPLQVASNGTRYKPLFSFMVLDMDGRLNVNAHGSTWHQDARYTDDLIPESVVDRANNPVSTANLAPRGQGYGPTEISLRPVFTANNLYQQLLVARYGVDGFPGRQQADPLTLDPWAEVRFFNYPKLHQSTLQQTGLDLKSFSSPHDLNGRFALTQALDGNPLYELTNPVTRVNELWENAYEMDLSDRSSFGENRPFAADTPFSVEEMEVLLRRYDVDAAGLPRRLAEIIPANDPTTGYTLTTDSWDLPTPGFVSPDVNTLVNAQGNRLESIVDYYIMRRGGTVTTQELATVFAPEVLMGQRMDLNRPFGDGLDLNGNGLVDEHMSDPNISESALGETMLGQVPLDPDNDGVINTQAAPNVDTDEYLARSIFARHLYVLMMTCMDPNVALDIDGQGGGSLNADEEKAYAVAQWAANVVDFRDQDSIMTPFEFDLDPFNGWSVDGDLATDEGNERGIVWGCERPELLITETVAWHDRRTEDLSDYETVAGGDPDFDQRLRPIGTSFIEVYNPNTRSQRAPAEFYSYAPNPIGVDLRAYNPSGSPVWRMVVMKGAEGKRRDLDHPDPSLRPQQNDLERTVYFVRETDVNSGTVSLPAGGFQYYLSDFVHQRLSPVPPLGYAVIGSQGTEVDAGGGVRQYWSKVGRRLDAIEGTPEDLKPEETRAIVLVPGQSVEIRYNKNANSIVRANTVAIPVDRPHSFNVSMPTDLYSSVSGGSAFDPIQASEEGVYTPVVDSPFDAQRNDDARATELAQNRTLVDWRVIHLQRLANPLQPYHPDRNPYLTVDSSSSDITPFNGVTDDGADPQANQQQRVEFTAFERGQHEVDNNLPSTQSFKLWRVEPTSPTPDAAWETGVDENGIANAGAGDHYFDFNIWETLGVLNRSYTNNPAIRVPPQQELVGFPWLKFNNRPFVSQLELLQVPASRSSRLLHDFSMASQGGGSPYQGRTTPSNDTLGVGYSQANNPRFGHLLNWFWTNRNPGNAPEFSRFLEYVHVPTRFVGHETYLNDAYFGGVNDPAGANAATAMRHPPFNKISNYREPGRININTISDPRVWQGLLGYVNNVAVGHNDAEHRPATFEEMVASRRGYTGTGAIWQLNNQYPTFFVNPFRPGGHGQLAPIPQMERPDIEATLLRSIESINNNNGTIPLMSRSPALTNIQPFEDGRRSSTFATDSIERLGNLVTTRSNVFAVWITVGYFEVTDSGLPDRELGADTGDVTRNRAFYILDRSRPVAYEPGANHNVDDMILLRRLIE